MANTASLKEANSYSEVLEVLNHMVKEDYEKVPKNMIEMFERYSNKENKFKYDLSKEFEEQNLSKDAKLILAVLFRDYWATPTQREKILAKQRYDRMQKEIEKQKIYNPDDIFKKRKTSVEETENNSNREQVSMIKYKEPFIKKIINKIKKIFEN